MVVSSLAVACMPEVIDEAGSKAGQNLNGNNGNNGAGGGSGNTEVHAAVAMSRAELDALWDAYWEEQGELSGSSSSSGGGGDLDPNDMFIRVSDLGASCSSPTTDLPCGGHWSVSLALPPAYQAVGVYDLEDPRIAQYSHMTESGEPYSPQPDDCGFGGGTIGSGTIEIVSITDDAVEFVLTLEQTFWNADPSGLYTAARCAP